MCSRDDDYYFGLILLYDDYFLHICCFTFRHFLVSFIVTCLNVSNYACQCVYAMLN